MERDGWLSQAAATSLKGRFVYAEAQTFSRAAAFLLAGLRRRALPGAPGAKADKALMSELDDMLVFLRDSVPRCIIARDSRRPVRVFTDASLDEDCTRAGVGAVLFVDAGPPRAFLSERVPEDLLAVLQTESVHAISALEVLPVFLARSLWADHVKHRRAFFFIDNDAARHSLIAGASPSPSITRALRSIVMHQAKVPTFAWYSRVPSASNIADEPSRFQLASLLSRGAERVPVVRDLWRAATS